MVPFSKTEMKASINWEKGGKSSGKKREKEGGYTRDYIYKGYTEFKEKWA